MNTRFSLLLSFMAAFLLPSCSTVTWNIGESIRRSGEVRVGVDVRQPVDGKLYRCEQGETMLVRAPEVTYSPCVPLVEWEIRETWGNLCLFADTDEVWLNAENLRPTGRTLVAETANLRDRRLVRVLPELPAHCEAQVAPEYRGRLSPAALGTLELRQQPSLGRKLAAAPFDYVADPALSLVSSLVLGTAHACAAAVWLPIHVYILGGKIH